MPAKTYLSANDLMLDSFRLGKQILDSGWRPDVVLALWRGGTPISLAVHELLAYCGVMTVHMSMHCRSYTGIGQTGTVTIEHSESVLARLQPDHNVLVVDDIFDTGNTARNVLELLRPLAAEVRLATLYWKTGTNVTDLRPDYHVRQTDAWIVFPHEMEGLTRDEIRQKDPTLHRLLFESAHA